ncbi:hypothetical protein SAMCCGM7_pC0822 (plasmid) [Sinorhizobium americanum CCGM7]|nr:hypothetical protein SAMCCGM7_pC0822 [Sinorhizobium americanum CCGM7]
MIGLVAALGDDPLKAVFAGDPKELFPTRLNFLRQSNDTGAAGDDDRLQQPPAFAERQPAQVSSSR